MLTVLDGARNPAKIGLAVTVGEGKSMVSTSSPVSGTFHRNFFFDGTALGELAGKNSALYQEADPFPHVALDDFLPTGVVDEVVAQFPARSDPLWHRAQQAWETKMSCEKEEFFPPAIRQLLGAFNSSTFVDFLEKLTGISGLIPDPHFRGGGMHSITRGGRLNIHADFNHYQRLNLRRRLNVLLYLNKEWPDEYGGKLELWSRDMRECVRAYAPTFNRCVIFSTNDDALHGHPNPLACPDDRTRNSLALYYYTADQESQRQPHSTLFQRRPESDDEAPQTGQSILRRISRKLRG